MDPARRVVRWLRTADAPVPRGVRTLRRQVARAQARTRHGSVVAHLEAVVARANSGVADPGGPGRVRPRSR